MISFEILVFEPESTDNLTFSGGFDIDHEIKSDRLPSKWQKEIFDKCSCGILVHLFDRDFSRNQEQRWLYSDVNEFKNERFKFISELDTDFINFVQKLVSLSKCGKIILTTDTQWGRQKKMLKNMSFDRFVSIYRNHGISINCAIPITISN